MRDAIPEAAFLPGAAKMPDGPERLGAHRRTRTGTPFPAADFKSVVRQCVVTTGWLQIFPNMLIYIINWFLL